MSDHIEVLTEIMRKTQHSGVSLPVLVPNLKGLNDAIQCGVKEIAVFTTASEEFCKRNVNCSIEQSIQRIKQVLNVALDKGIKVRG